MFFYFGINFFLVYIWWRVLRRPGYATGLDWLNAIAFHLGTIFLVSLALGLPGRNLTHNNLIGGAILVSLGAWALNGLSDSVGSHLLFWLRQAGTACLNLGRRLIRRPARPFSDPRPPAIIPPWQGLADSLKRLVPTLRSLPTNFTSRVKTGVASLRKLESYALVVLILNPLGLLFLWQMHFRHKLAGLIPIVEPGLINTHILSTLFIHQNSTISFHSAASAGANFFPKTAHLFFFWQLGFTGQLDTLRMLPYPFYLLGAFAVFLLVRSFQAGVIPSLLAASLLLFFPAVLQGVITPDPLLVTTALFLSAVTLSLGALQTGRINLAQGAGLVTGLYVSCGPATWVAGLVLVLLVGSVFLMGPGERPLASRTGQLFILILVALHLAALWPLTGYSKTGSPFFPEKPAAVASPIHFKPHKYLTPAGLPPGGPTYILAESDAPKAKKNKVKKGVKKKKKLQKKSKGKEPGKAKLKLKKGKSAKLFPKVKKKPALKKKKDRDLFDALALKHLRLHSAGLLGALVLLPSLLTGAFLLRRDEQYWKLLLLVLLTIFILFLRPKADTSAPLIAACLALCIFGVVFDRLPKAFKWIHYVFILLLALYAAYTASIGAPTKKKNKSNLFSPALIAGYEFAPKKLRNPNPILSFNKSSTVSGASRALAKWRLKNKIQNKSIVINRRLSHSPIYLYDNHLKNRIYYFDANTQPRKLRQNKKLALAAGIPPDFDFIIGRPKDAQGIKTKAVQKLPGNFTIYKVLEKPKHQNSQKQKKKKKKKGN